MMHFGVKDTPSHEGEVIRLHHIGFVIANISEEAQTFASSLGATWGESVFRDPLQKATVTFLRAANPGDALIELIEPTGEESPVLQFLRKGGGLHHLCYEVRDMSAQLDYIRGVGGVVVRRPRPAVAFGDRLIAWVVTRHKLLIEYLQGDAPSLNREVAGPWKSGRIR